MSSENGFPNQIALLLRHRNCLRGRGKLCFINKSMRLLKDLPHILVPFGRNRDYALSFSQS